MTVTKVSSDTEALTLTVTAHFDAPVSRVWRLWEDPRLLEKWWGPPDYPATVTHHEFVPGGAVRYHMTGPDGATPAGWWRFETIEPPHRIEFEDGFLDEDGNKNEEMPSMRISVEIVTENDGRTKMTTLTTFSSTADMEQLIAMGMVEGMRAAMGQIDDILAAHVA